MIHLLGQDVTWITLTMLFVAFVMALAFEFVNGFHDTSNAVATVIYTNSLSPATAVIWSGVWNFLGVLCSGTAVAYSIVALLPVDLVLGVGTAADYAMVFGILLSALIWNFATWYRGIPASSSHTLIGAIIGVGLMHALWLHQPIMEGFNPTKLLNTVAALIFSPLLGFFCTALLFLMLRYFLRSPKWHQAPQGQNKPPFLIRTLLILTSTGVSFSHGSNDGQKGQGLLMLIFICMLPGAFSLNPTFSVEKSQRLLLEINQIQPIIQQLSSIHDINNIQISEARVESRLRRFIRRHKTADASLVDALIINNNKIANRLHQQPKLQLLDNNERHQLRTSVYLQAEAFKLLNLSSLKLSSQENQVLHNYQADLNDSIQFLPLWIKIVVAFALGLGTMVGWRRIVVTIGEKIGRNHLTYSQGAAAELVAAATIQAASSFGLPVSTTHILSSGIAGAMVANRDGLQAKTVRNILIAWILTIPATVFLGASVFGGVLFFIFRVTGH